MLLIPWGLFLTFTLDLGLAQIYPVWDEDTSDERSVVAASFAESYLLIIRDDQSLLLLQADRSGDLDEIEIEGDLSSSKWLSGCLYHDKYHVFLPNKSDPKPSGNTLMILLRADHTLFVSSLNHTTI